MILLTQGKPVELCCPISRMTFSFFYLIMNIAVTGITYINIELLFFSYKLWYNYLRLRRKQIQGRCITDPGYDDVNNAFERSLVFMHKVSDFG